MMESSSTGPADMPAPPSALGRIQDTTGQTQDSAASHLRCLPLPADPQPDAPPPAAVDEDRYDLHSFLAAVPRTEPHLSDMWLSQRWSLLHLSRMDRLTAAMFRSSAGGSLARMQSMASSGRSSTDGSPVVSVLSTLAAGRFLLKDGMRGMASAAVALEATPPSSL